MSTQRQPISSQTQVPIDNNPQRSLTIDKFISLDNLSYLPNIYLRQYKMIDELIRIRHDFPEQKVLVPRSRTNWDTLLEDVKYMSKLRNERKKYKSIVNSQIVKQAKVQVQRENLRNEQIYHFHRLIGSHLSQQVNEAFKVKEIEKKEINEEIIASPKKISNQIDNIFVEPNEDMMMDGAEDDFVADLLGGVNDRPEQMEIRYENESYQSLESYIKQVNSLRQEQLDLYIGISRKSSLKRINQNVRRRLKIKQEEEDASRSLSSATVFLSNLLANQSQTTAKNIIEAVNQSQWLFGLQKSRKRKEEDGFQLRWAQQQIDKMQSRNEKGCLKKGKIDNGVLTYIMPKTQQQYKLTFQKQINSKKSFPPTLRSVPSHQPKRNKKYYNQFYDRQYEQFVMRFNKKKLFQQFASKANYIFSQNFSHDENQESDSMNVGNLFIRGPQQLLNKVIFHKSERYVAAAIRSDPSHGLDSGRALLLAFLVKQYLQQFGNSWKNITQLISMHLAYLQYHITPQLVQEVYQTVCKLYKSFSSTPDLELWDKKILPSSNVNISSYSVLNNNQTPYVPLNPNKYKQNKQQQIPLTASSYASMIDEEEQEDENTNPYQTLEPQFGYYVDPLAANIYRLNNGDEQKQLQIQKMKSIIQKYKISTQKIPYTQQLFTKPSGPQPSKLKQSLKAQIKASTPFRKKKNINDRSNQLVKIITNLRNKTNIPSNPATIIPKKIQDNKLPNGPTQIKTNNMTQSAPPKPVQPNNNPPPSSTVEESNKRLSQPPSQIPKTTSGQKKKIGGNTKGQKKGSKDDDNKK